MISSLPGYLWMAYAAFAVVGLFAARFPDAPGAGMGALVSTVLIALPALGGLVRRFGLIRAGYCVGLLSALGFAVELVGVITGFPYGRFYYSGELGPELGGHVPYILPVSWVPLVLGAVAATEPVGGGRSRLDYAGWVLRAAGLLVLLDGVLDPGAALLGLWVWPTGGAYYGVPASNYLGWLLSSLLAVGLILSLAPWMRTLPVPAMLDSVLIALAFWTAVALANALFVPAVLGLALTVWLASRRAALRRWTEDPVPAKGMVM